MYQRIRVAPVQAVVYEESKRKALISRVVIALDRGSGQLSWMFSASRNLHSPYLPSSRASLNHD
jgi:hypothetical protein